MDKIIKFKIHTPNLLKEIANLGLREESGVLYQPLNQLRLRLIELAELAMEINDPRLLLWCYDMTLFDSADPDSKEYNIMKRQNIIKAIKKLNKKWQTSKLQVKN